LLWPSDGANRIMQPACSAGPAVRPLRSAQGRLCGSSSHAGSCRAANKGIRIIMGHAVNIAAQWKSRKAGERALRYIPFRGAGLFGGQVSPHTYATPTYRGQDGVL